MGLFGGTPIWMREGLDYTRAIDRALDKVKSLNNREKLRQAAMEAPNNAVRRQAIWRIAALGDRELLKDVAMHGDDGSVAVECMTEHDDLVEVARGAQKSWARSTALKKLGDEALCTEAALHDPAWDVREAAVKLVTDGAVLAQVAQHDTAREVRRAAIGKLTNPIVLEVVAREDFDHDNRQLALELLDDPELRRDVEASWSEEQKEESARVERERRLANWTVEQERQRKLRHEQDRKNWAKEGRCPHCGVYLAMAPPGSEGAALYCSNCHGRIR